MKKEYLVLMLILISFVGFSQNIERQVIGSAGQSFSNATLSMDFTVGELVVTTITDGSSILTQGFHQGEIQLSINVGILAYLQGTAINPNTGEEALMRDDLRISNNIPLLTPYTDALTCNVSIFGVTGNDAIVDWVWVELRDKNDTSSVLASQSALLQRDGDVVGVDGISSLTFEMQPDSYYIMISHRSHIPILSATPITLSNSLTSIDFTQDTSNSYGGINALYDLGTGYFALFAGDYDANGQIQNLDIQSVSSQRGLSGYLDADLDMNGQVQNTDINTILHPNKGRGIQF